MLATTMATETSTMEDELNLEFEKWWAALQVSDAAANQLKDYLRGVWEAGFNVGYDHALLDHPTDTYRGYSDYFGEP